MFHMKKLFLLQHLKKRKEKNKKQKRKLSVNAININIQQLEGWKSKVAWIPFVHGWIYAVYLLTALQFSVKARWELRRVIWLALAGTLPIASFIAERKIVKTYS